jgi:hypothetical protein
MAPLIRISMYVCVPFVYVVDLVGIATACELDGWGSISGRGKRFSSTLQCPDRPWDAPSLLSNGYRRFFPREYIGRAVEVTGHLHLLPRSRMEVYMYSSWHGA